MANKETRINLLEKQIETAEATSLTKDKRIIDLEKQLADAVKDRITAADQVAMLTAKNDRIEELEKLMTVNDHNHRMDLMKVINPSTQDLPSAPALLLFLPNPFLLPLTNSYLTTPLT